ncbi:unnamed protein product [Acanthoscelides obtectus]|uniref:Uncharacterized protein n=1 Tax=Acanthoscelides obtectus TaxID=200917 RepID=A0A9P0JQV3_ACAOB|nr:unnamed protein product [Acanthoscelides obtectus]CAK1671190.1 hypothetical protein AOBTE_LOCUS28127 [Acanthoscelides obtectus]
MWLLQERNRHAPISGPMLAMKAKFSYKEITKKMILWPAKDGYNVLKVVMAYV